MFAAGDFNRDGIPDLYAIKVRNTGTNSVEVHILDGSSNYQARLSDVGTPISQADAPNFVFAVGDFNRDGTPDLYAIKVRNTGSGTVEIHVLDGASNYQSFLLHTATSITEADAPNLTFSVGDFNRDGVPDVYAIKVRNTGTGNLEVHILNGVLLSDALVGNRHRDH